MASNHEIMIQIGAKLAKNFNATMTGAAKSVAALGKNAIKGTAKAITGASVAMGALAIDAAKAGIEYESAFAGVKKTVNESANTSYDDLSAGIMKMSSQMPTAATEIAAVAEAAGQLGIQTDSILGFTKTMVQLGDSTNLSADEAATTLARFANVTGMSQNNFDKLGSTIVNLGNNYATTESEIANMGQRLASAGTQVGMSEADIMGFAAALSSVGLEAEAGGTAFSKLLVDMQVATESGGEKLQQFADVAGMSSEEFKSAFEKDAAGAIQSFTKGLGDAEKNGKSAIGILTDMGITETRLRDTLLRAAGASDLMGKAVKDANKAWKENTALSNEAEQRYSTMESQLKMLKNGFTNLKTSIYMGDMKNPLADMVKQANTYLGQLQGAYDTGGMSGLTSSLGSVAADAITRLSEGLPDLVNAGADMINNLVTGIGNNADRIGAALANAGGSLLSGIFKIAPELVAAGGDLINSFVQGVASNSYSLMSEGMQAASKLMDGITQKIPDFVNAALSLVAGLAQGFIDNAPQLIQSAIMLLAQVNMSFWQAVPQLVVTGAQMILGLVQGIVQNLPLIIQSAVQVAMQFISGIVQALPQVIQCGIQAVVSLLQGIIQSLPTLIEAGFELLGALVSGLISALPSLIEAAFAIPEAVITAIFETDWIEVGGRILESIWNGLVNAAKSIGGAILDLLGIDTGEDEAAASAAGMKVGQTYSQSMKDGAGSGGKFGDEISQSTFSSMNYTAADMAGMKMATTYNNSFQASLNTSNIDTASMIDTNSNALKAASSGNAVGNSYTSAVKSGVSSSTVDATRVINKEEAISTLGNTGTQAGQTFTSSMNTSLTAGGSVDISGKVNTAGVNSKMAQAGFQGMAAFTAAIITGSATVMAAVTALSNNVNNTFTQMWSQVNAGASAGMARVAATVRSWTDSIISSVTSAFANMRIVIPLPQVPKIDMTITTRTVKAGKNSQTIEIPHFNAHYAQGGIFTKPTFFMGPNGSGEIGEKGPEAVLPLDRLWKEMRKAINEGDKSKRPRSASKGIETPMQLVYSPNITINGNADKQAVESGLKSGYSEFKKYMREYEKQHNRKTLYG